MKWTTEDDEFICSSYALSATSKSGLTLVGTEGTPAGHMSVNGMVVKGAHGEFIKAAEVSSRLHQLRMVNPEYLNGLFELDPSVPSGLRWKSGRFAGEAAGRPSGAYWRVRMGGVLFLSHIIITIMTELSGWEKVVGVQSEWLVDHIQSLSAGGMNSADNLRVVSVRENNQNCASHQSGRLVGASFHKPSGKWQAGIEVKGFKRKHLGLFTTEQEAHSAYVEALQQLEAGTLQLTSEPHRESITFDLLMSKLGISEESPSGLMWIAGQNKGKPAGCLRPTGNYLVDLQGKKILAHHIVALLTEKEGWEQLLEQLNGDRKGLVVDHCDGNHMNNIPTNLRIITQRQNSSNQKVHRLGASVGVSCIKRNKAWQVLLTKPGDSQQTRYGRRKTPAEAIDLRNAVWYSWVEAGLTTWSELLLPDDEVPERPEESIMALAVSKL